MSLSLTRKEFSQVIFRKICSKLWASLSASAHPTTHKQMVKLRELTDVWKNYLRCMAFTSPKKWHHYMSDGEWWYNTSFHTSMGMTPFQALNGIPPPMVAEAALPNRPNEEVQGMLKRKQATLQLLKDNLLRAHERMKHFADKKN